MKAFVTGGTGFIGRRLIDELLRCGAEVVTLSRKEHPRLPETVKVVRGDILNPESIRHVGRGCDRLYHLAGLVTFDSRRRADLMAVNAQGTENVLVAAERWGVRRSVVVSSAITLGLSPSPDRVLDETASATEADASRNPYLGSKRAMEEIALQRAVRQDVVIVNPTTVYGPGDWSLNSGTLVLAVARASLMPVPPGGSNVVDVDDVVAGIVAAGERGRSGRRYILGGSNLAFSGIFSTIADVVGRRPVFVPLARWMRGPMTLAAWLGSRVVGGRFLSPHILRDMFAFKYYSIERARQELGYSPRYSFARSVERAWRFYQEAGLAESKT